MLKNYVSEVDQFLQDFDKTAAAHSASRAYEEAKHQRIAEARDNPEVVLDKPNDVWDKSKR